MSNNPTDLVPLADAVPGWPGQRIRSAVESVSRGVALESSRLRGCSFLLILCLYKLEFEEVTESLEIHSGYRDLNEALTRAQVESETRLANERSRLDPQGQWMPARAKRKWPHRPTFWNGSALPTFAHRLEDGKGWNALEIVGAVFPTDPNCPINGELVAAIDMSPELIEWLSSRTSDIDVRDTREKAASSSDVEDAEIEDTPAPIWNVTLPNDEELRALRKGLRKRKPPSLFDGMWCSEPGIGGMSAKAIDQDFLIHWVCFEGGVLSAPREQAFSLLCRETALERERLELGYVVEQVLRAQGKKLMDSIGHPTAAWREAKPYREGAECWRHWAIVKAGYMLGI